MAATQRNDTGVSAEFAQKNSVAAVQPTELPNLAQVAALINAATPLADLLNGKFILYGKYSDNEPTSPGGRLTLSTDPTRTGFQLFGASISPAGNAIIGSAGKLTSVAGSLVAMAFTFATITVPTRQYHPRLRGKFQTPSTLANLRLWFGMFASDPSTSATPPANCMAFRYENGTDTNFQCITKDATTPNTQDSGIIAAVDTVYQFEIKVTPAGNAEFYIGVGGGAMALVKTSSSNLPVSTVNLGSQLGLYGKDKAAATVFLIVSDLTLTMD